MSGYIDPRNKALWHLDRLEQIQRSGRTNAPVNVEIDLSNRCSLGCAWCHFAYTHTRGPLAGTKEKPQGAILGGDLMDKGLALRILGEMRRVGVKSVTWTGGGEPTLHPHFDEIIAYAADLGLQQGLYTHGGHITETKATLLKRAATWVYVSLDECTADAYKRSKGTDRFGAACEGIRRLAEAKGGATIGVGFLIHAGNYQQAQQMIALGKSLGADYVQFRPTVHYDAHEPGKVTEDTAWMKYAVAVMRGVASDPFVSVDIARFEEYQHWQGHGYGLCYWAALQTVVTPNGKVWRCVNKREQPGALLGDLAEEPFSKVWRRAGGTCGVDGGCRAMCRGHVANQTLTHVLSEPAHANFI